MREEMGWERKRTEWRFIKSFCGDTWGVDDISTLALEPAHESAAPEIRFNVGKRVFQKDVACRGGE